MFGLSQPYKAGMDDRIIPSQRNWELRTPTSRWYISGQCPPPTGRSNFTSPTDWGLEKKNTFGILNSHCLWQFYLLFPPLYCHRTTSLKPSYVTDLFSFHQITWASSGTNSATLKMEAVCSSKMAEHLSLHSSETRRQQSVHMPWKPANVHQVTRI